MSLTISKSKSNELIVDPRKAAKAATLIYVSDQADGITRIKRGKSFSYFINNKKVSSPGDLERIKKLAIPPAWKNVWICKNANGHIQCTGIDSKNRKQYKYHGLWIGVRSQAKYDLMKHFGKALGLLRKQVRKDLNSKELNENKVIASVISVMEQTFIRIGNNAYEKMNGSYGLTTLKDKHVKINGDSIQFTFNGKSNINHKISFRNKKLARIVKQCRDIPGKELFQYLGSDGKFHAIDSGKVNDYIKRITGSTFTAKDFRTWAGSVNAIQYFMKKEYPSSEREKKDTIQSAIDHVSKVLGNTKNVCRKYYIHPRIIELYESGNLVEYFKGVKVKSTGLHAELNMEEKVLLKVLS